MRFRSQLRLLGPLVVVNMLFVAVPLLVARLSANSYLLPGDTGTYLSFFKNDASPLRTAGYPLLLLLVSRLTDTIQYQAVLVNLLALISASAFIWFSRAFLVSYCSGSDRLDAYVPFYYILLVMSCPALCFLFLLPLADFSYTVLSTAILFSLLDSSHAFSASHYLSLRRSRRLWTFIFVLGVMFGLVALIRPVGALLPFFLVALYGSLCIARFILIRSSLEVNSKSLQLFGQADFSVPLVRILIPFFLGSLVVLSSYSFYSHYRFGNYNFLGVASVNSQCYRSFQSLASDSAERSYSIRKECLDSYSNGKRMDSNKNSDVASLDLPFLIRLPFLLLVAFIRGVIECDYVSLLRYLGYYKDPSLGQPASLDFLYTLQIIPLLKQFTLRIRADFVILFFVLVAGSMLLSIRFLLFLFNVCSRRLTTRSEYGLLLFSCLSYYLIVSTGPDTVGRYYAPILSLMLYPLFNAETLSPPGFRNVVTPLIRTPGGA